MRKLIYGVFEKNEHNSYLGFFEHEDDARKELEIQMVRLQNEGIEPLVLEVDRVLNNDKIILIIHTYVLR